MATSRKRRDCSGCHEMRCATGCRRLGSTTTKGNERSGHRLLVAFPSRGLWNGKRQSGTVHEGIPTKHLILTTEGQSTKPAFEGTKQLQSAREIEERIRSQDAEACFHQHPAC